MINKPSGKLQGAKPLLRESSDSQDWLSLLEHIARQSEKDKKR
jgi:hypothetical protein